jgi:hypothetical protein
MYFIHFLIFSSLIHYFCLFPKTLTIWFSSFLKDLPKYMLFESSYGYALFQVFGMHNIETHYIATEKYIQNFNTIFRFVACYAFGSTDEALKYLNAIKNSMFLTLSIFYLWIVVFKQQC